MAMANDAQQTAERLEHERFLRRLKRVSPAAALFALAVSALTLVGWVNREERLVRLAPDSGAMVPLTALGILACAVSLLLLAPGRARSALTYRVGIALAMFAVLAGVAIALNYLYPESLQFDLYLFPRALEAFSHERTPRPSPLTAVCLLATGSALLLLKLATRRGLLPAQILAVLVGLIAAQTITSYVYDTPPLLAPEGTIFHVSRFNTMAVQTALCFGILCLGILYARPDRGLISPFHGDNPGSHLARRLFPAVIIAPFLVGWLGALGQRRGFYDVEYGLSFVVMMTILLMMALIAWLARALRKLDLERRQALQISRESEALFRAIFENAGLGIGVVSADGRPVRSNRKLQVMLGYTSEELSQMEFSEFTHPDDLATGTELFREVMAGRSDSYSIEKRYVRKDGRVIWGLLTTSVARDEQGRPSVYIGTVTDITAAKEAEEAQRRLTAILEATPDFVGLTDAHGNAVYINKAGRELVGLGGDDLTGLSIPDFHPPEVSKFLFEVAIPVAMREGVWEGEARIVRSDGREVPVSQAIMVHFGPSGEVQYLSTVIRDISERRRMENTQKFLLEASRKLSASLELEAVLQNVLDMSVPSQGDYCVIDLIAEGGTVARAAMKHRDPDQQLLLEEARRFSPTPGTQPGLPSVLRTGESFKANDLDAQTLRKIAQNQEHYELLQRLHPTSLLMVPLVASGRVIGVLTLACVTPERRFDEADLSSAEELAGRAALALENARLFRSAKEATHVRDEVLRIVAHDLRNPLNSILLSAQVLREAAVKPESGELANLVDVIVRSVERANRLIQDLLDVARLEAGQLALEKAAVDVSELVQEAVEAQTTITQKKSITLEAQIAPDLPAVDCDHDRMLQVLSNLIDNATRFTESGGRITINVQQENGAVLFAVSDTGPGIEPGDMPRLFDRFWQARKGSGGAGLGLGIARGIVEAHGGRIWAESEVGHGSTFYFTVPARPPEQRRQDAAAD